MSRILLSIVLVGRLRSGYQGVRGQITLLQDTGDAEQCSQYATNGESLAQPVVALRTPSGTGSLRFVVGCVSTTGNYTGFPTVTYLFDQFGNPSVEPFDIIERSNSESCPVPPGGSCCNVDPSPGKQIPCLASPGRISFCRSTRPVLVACPGKAIDGANSTILTIQASSPHEISLPFGDAIFYAESAVTLLLTESSPTLQVVPVGEASYVQASSFGALSAWADMCPVSQVGLPALLCAANIDSNSVETELPAPTASPTASPVQTNAAPSNPPATLPPQVTTARTPSPTATPPSTTAPTDLGEQVSLYPTKRLTQTDAPVLQASSQPLPRRPTVNNSPATNTNPPTVKLTRKGTLSIRVSPRSDSVETVIVTSAPLNGNVLVEDDLTVVFYPNPNFAGTDTFVVESCDVSGRCETLEITAIVSTPSSIREELSANTALYALSVLALIPLIAAVVLVLKWRKWCCWREETREVDTPVEVERTSSAARIVPPPSSLPIPADHFEAAAERDNQEALASSSHKVALQYKDNFRTVVGGGPMAMADPQGAVAADPVSSVGTLQGPPLAPAILLGNATVSL